MCAITHASARTLFIYFLSDLVIYVPGETKPSQMANESKESNPFSLDSESSVGPTGVNMPLTLLFSIKARLCLIYQY